MRPRELLRHAGNWCNLSTPLGLALALLGRGRFRRRVRGAGAGLIVVEKVRLPLAKASAMTVGDVVLVFERSVDDAVRRIPGLLAHEEEHAWQYAYCLGLPFLPLYGVATLYSLATARDRASANFFEVQAGLELGGYQPKRRAERAA